MSPVKCRWQKYFDVHQPQYGIRLSSRPFHPQSIVYPPSIRCESPPIRRQRNVNPISVYRHPPVSSPPIYRQLNTHSDVIPPSVPRQSTGDRRWSAGCHPGISSPPRTGFVERQRTMGTRGVSEVDARFPQRETKPGVETVWIIRHLLRLYLKDIFKLSANTAK